VLQLHKSCTNCGNVRLLITERHTSSSLRIFQFGVDVDSSIANASVQSIHNQGQFNCTRKPTTRKRDNNEKTFNNDKKGKEKRRWSSSSYARIDLSIGLLCVWSPYPLSTDVVRRQQRLFCEGLVAEKHLERSQRQTISTALFVLAYPGSRMGNVKVISLELYLHDATDNTLIVGDETQRYNLSSSCIQVSINCCTEFSSCIMKNRRNEIFVYNYGPTHTYTNTRQLTWNKRNA
jgi:hypothetical protein